jgi:hypothetical protein
MKNNITYITKIQWHLYVDCSGAFNEYVKLKQDHTRKNPQKLAAMEHNNSQYKLHHFNIHQLQLGHLD